MKNSTKILIGCLIAAFIGLIMILSGSLLYSLGILIPFSIALVAVGGFTFITGLVSAPFCRCW